MVTDISNLMTLLALTILSLASYLISKLCDKSSKRLSVISILILVATLASAIAGPNMTVPDFLALCILIAIVSISFLRIIANRSPKGYLVSQTARTAWHTASLIIVWLGFSLGYLLLPRVTLFSISWMIIILAAYLSTRLLMRMLSMLRKKVSDDLPSDSLPSLTVAIPARNEDAVLESSLHSILETNYEKLEIIVLDDCSQDGTSQIIQSFARSGVRFIQGQAPSGEWYGKNWAYQQLLENTNSDYILFCGADIHLSPGSLKRLVSVMIRGQLLMMAVLPKYQMSLQTRSFLEHFQQVARYFWQSAMTSFFSAYPPAGGSCWLVSRQWLETNGGFRSSSHMISPERLLAKTAHDQRAYAYIHSDCLAGESVESSKRGFEQTWHMIRVAYPLMHRDIVLTMVAIVMIPLVYLAPLTQLILLFVGNTEPTIGTYALALSGLSLLASYLLIHYLTSPRSLIIAPISLFIVPLYVCAMLVWSMLKYEFSSVQWKGRSICLPVIGFRLQTQAEFIKRK